MKRIWLITAVVLSAPASILAQSSASYKLDEHVINAGGRPEQAIVASSSSYKISLDSIGEANADRALSGASIRMDGGFTTAYPPPGEVGGLEILADLQTLTWFRDSASMTYNIYKGPLSTLPGGYGDCAVSWVAGNSWVDPSMPDPHGGLFYLVTGENRLREEGTKGQTSTGVERANSTPCP